MNRDERIEHYYNWSAWELAEHAVSLEEENDKLLSELMSAKSKLDLQELDEERVESALRMYIAELDYDIHKMLESPEDGGPDRYPDEVGYFLRCWDTAGEG